MNFLCVIRIDEKDLNKTLDIFESLHTDEILNKMISTCNEEDKRFIPIFKDNWNRWKRDDNNIIESLMDAFNMWCFYENECADYTIRWGVFKKEYGYYGNSRLHGFLIEKLSPVLKNIIIPVYSQKDEIKL